MYSQNVVDQMALPSSYNRNSNRLSESQRKCTAISGALLIILGLVCIACQIVILVWAKENGECKFYFFTLSEAVPDEAAGIWVGLLMVIAGVVGLITWSKNNFGMVMIQSAVSFIAILLLCALIGLTGVHIKDLKMQFCELNDERLPLILDGIMIAAGMLALIISAAIFTIALNSICHCCREEPLAPPEYTVSYHYNVQPPQSTGEGISNPGYGRGEMEHKMP